MSDSSSDHETDEAIRAKFIKQTQQAQKLVDQLEATIKQAVSQSNSFVVFEREEDADHTVFLSNFEILHRVFKKNMAFSLSSQLEFSCYFTTNPVEVKEFSEQAAVFFLDHCTSGELQATLRSKNGAKRMTLEEVTTLLQRMCQGESPLLDIVMELGDDLRSHKLVDAQTVTHWSTRVEYLGEWLAGTLGRYVAQNREELLRASQVEFGTEPSAVAVIKSEDEIVRERLAAWLELKENDVGLAPGQWPTKDSDIRVSTEELKTLEGLQRQSEERGYLLEYRTSEISIRSEVRKELALANPLPPQQEALPRAGEAITRDQQRDAIVLLAGTQLYSFVQTPEGKPWEVSATPTLSPAGWAWVYLKSTPRKYRWVYGDTGVPGVNHHTAWGKLILQIVERENRMAKRGEAKSKFTSQSGRKSGSSPSKGATKPKTQDRGPFGVDRHFIKRKQTNDRYNDLGRRGQHSQQLALLKEDAEQQLGMSPNPQKKRDLRRRLEGYKAAMRARNISFDLNWRALNDRGRVHGMSSFVQPARGNHGRGRSSQSSFTAQSGSRARGRGSGGGKSHRTGRRDESRGVRGRRDESRGARANAGAGAGAGPDRGPNTRSSSRERRGRRSSTPDSQRNGRRSSSRDVAAVDYSAGGSRSASGYAVQGTLSSTKSPTDARRIRRLSHELTDDGIQKWRTHILASEIHPYDNHTPHTPTQTDTDHSYIEYMSGYDGSQTEDDGW
jgi:hypothetical protein